MYDVYILGLGDMIISTFWNITNTSKQAYILICFTLMIFYQYLLYLLIDFVDLWAESMQIASIFPFKAKNTK